MKFLSALALVLGFAGTANAATAAIHDCEGLDSIQYLIGQTKNFEDHAITVAYVSTEEPAAAPDHVLFYVAAGEEYGVNCYAVSAQADETGFSSVDWDGLRAKYVQGQGLIVKFGVSKYDNETGYSKPDGYVQVLINRADVNNPKVSILK